MDEGEGRNPRIISGVGAPAHNVAYSSNRDEEVGTVDIENSPTVQLALLPPSVETLGRKKSRDLHLGSLSLLNQAQFEAAAKSSPNPTVVEPNEEISLLVTVDMPMGWRFSEPLTVGHRDGFRTLSQIPGQSVLFAVNPA